MPGTTIFYSGNLLSIAYEAARRADASARDAPDHLTNDALVAIVLAASAAEGFLNDLVGAIGRAGDAFGPLAAVAEALDSMDEERCSVRARYLAAGVLLGCDALRKGKEPFQSFDDVSALRNAIVHVKPIDLDEANRPARIAAALGQRGIARQVPPRQPDAPTGEPWLAQIRTPETAWWAADSASALMIQLAESVIATADSEGARTLFLRLADNVRELKERRESISVSPSR